MKLSRILKAALSTVALGLISVTAWAGGAGAWMDDFEAYALNSAIAGQGGWEEWIGSVDVSGHIKNVPAGPAGAKNLEIVGNPGGTAGLGDDTVQQFRIVGGHWIFKAQTNVPNAATGEAFIIMLNEYGGAPTTWNWSLQVHLNADTGMVQNDLIGGGMSTTLVKGSWVEFKADIDLTSGAEGSVDYFYNGVEYDSNRSWTNAVSGGGFLQIENLDLYGGEPTSGGTTGTFYDAVMLTPAPTRLLPTDFVKDRGGAHTGNLDSLKFDDADRLVVPQTAPFLVTQGNIEVRIGFTAPAGAVSALEFLVDLQSNGSPGGNVPQTIEGRVWASDNHFVELARNPSTQGDTLRTVLVNTDPGRFIRAADNRIEMRVRSFDRGALFVNWATRYDMTNINHFG